MKSLGKKIIKYLVTSTLAVMITLSLANNAFAATGVYLGAGYPYGANGRLDLEILGHVYYNSNDQYQMDVYSLCQWVYNNGSEPVNHAEYLVATGDQSRATLYNDHIVYEFPIVPDTNRRLEMDWATVLFRTTGVANTSYQKNGNPPYVNTYFLAANSGLGGGGWNSYWYAGTGHDDYFILYW